MVGYSSDKKNIPVKVVNTIYSRYVKRGFDICLSGLALMVLSPVFLILIILELLFHGRPVLYKTMRPGKNGKIFKLYKFRSMTNARDSRGVLLPEKERLTSFGRFIRKTSLDELPELINIFKGDMSIIGPRPLLVEYMDYYSTRHAQRHAVRPGLACFRIIKTDSTTWTWRDQFENDIWYVEHISFLTDIKMVYAVLREVLKASDIRAEDERLPFTGDNLDEIRCKSEVEEYHRYDSISR